MVRVTGLLLVLLYHFFKTAFPGGFIGVDIFFTFSGYLITALLIDEYAKNKKIDLFRLLQEAFLSYCASVGVDDSYHYAVYLLGTQRLRGKYW